MLSSLFLDNQQLEKYLVRPRGEHSRAAFASLLEDIEGYHDYCILIPFCAMQKREKQTPNKVTGLATDNCTGM